MQTPLCEHLIITNSSALSLGKENLYIIFSKFNPIDTDTLLIQTLSIPSPPPLPLVRISEI